MADANKLIPFILKWEGGFVKDPLDRGGATNKGITLNTFRYFLGERNSEYELKNMNERQWEYIFREGYWNPFKGGYINNQSIADICVDWAWASGTKTAIKKVQAILGVDIDGVVGMYTIKAINSADQRDLFRRIKQSRILFVESIVKRNPSQKRFLNGWINRINSITFRV